MPAPVPASRFEVWTFPTYDEWIKGTALGITHPRSDRLKKIDEALKAYQEAKAAAKLALLRSAFRDWTDWKGATWEKSDRNTAAKGALFTRLDKALKSTRAAGKPVDRAALEWQEQQRREAVRRLFEHKQVTLKFLKSAEKSATTLEKVKNAVKDVKTAAPSGASSSSLTDIKQAMEAMVAKMFDVSSISAITHHLATEFGGDVVASVLPILGQCKSAVMVVKAWGDLGVATYTQYSNAQHGYVFAPGDPSAAFRALDSMLRTDINRAGASAAIATADFGTRALLTLADGGIASGAIVGAVTAVAKLTKRIFELSCEYRETKAVNILLRDPANLGFKLFKAKPLLGCYMICCASDWDLMNMASEEFGMDGWMDDAQAMKKDHITPVRTTAHAFIDKSIYEIKGLTSLAVRPVTAAGVLKSAKNKLTSHKKMDAMGSATP